MEDIKIDFEELQKQQEKEIKKTGKYIEIKYLAGKGIKNPICNIKINGCSTVQLAETLTTLKVIMKKIIETDPMAGILASSMGARGICYDENTKESGIIDV